MAKKQHSLTILPLDDDMLKKFIDRVERGPNGALPWTIGEPRDAAFAERLNSLGVQLEDDAEGKRCWVWIGATTKAGRYGGFSAQGMKREAHRVSYATYKELPLPPGAQKHIHHICKNSLCVRPGGKHAGPLSPEDHMNLERWLKRGKTHPELAIDGPEGFVTVDASAAKDETD